MQNVVLHYTLSWAEGQDVTREEMMRAVNGSLAVLGETAGRKGGRNSVLKKKDAGGSDKKKLGRVAIRDQFATEHQVLVVAHNDTPSMPHVHVVVNRVHPEHGVMLPSSNDFKVLSRWAERYERETTGITIDWAEGHKDEKKIGVIVDQRAINNAARDRHESVPGRSRIPCDVYELDPDPRDKRLAAEAVRAEQRAKDAALAKRSAAAAEARRENWKSLAENHRARKAELRQRISDQVDIARQGARDAFSQDWATLHHEHRAAEEAFDRREEHLAGQAMNALKALLSLKAPVNVLWSRGSRKNVLEEAQMAQKEELAARQRRAEEQAAQKTRARLQAQFIRLRQRFLEERTDLIIQHEKDAEGLRQGWKRRRLDREQAWEEHRKAMNALPAERRFGAQMTEPDERTKKALSSEEKRRAALRRELEDLHNDRGDQRGR